MLTPAQIKEVVGLAAILTQEQIADYLSIEREDFKAALASQPEAAAQYSKARAIAIAKVQQSLIKGALAGDKSSAIYYLKSQNAPLTTSIATEGAGAGADDDELIDSEKELLLAQLIESNPRCDLQRIAMYVDYYFVYRASQDDIVARGAIVTNPTNGKQQENPHLKVRDKASAQMQRMRLNTDGVWQL